MQKLTYDTKYRPKSRRGKISFSRPSNFPRERFVSHLEPMQVEYICSVAEKGVYEQGAIENLQVVNPLSNTYVFYG